MNFSTYLGGSNEDNAFAIAIDKEGNSYITGETYSANFPTKNAYQSVYGKGSRNAFVAKFSLNGSLIFSTYLGNNSLGLGIAVDSNGNSYVTGYTSSTTFPLKNAYQSTYGGGSNDVFVTKFNSSGGLVFSTYLGGSSDDFGTSIAVDGSGNCYLTGGTNSRNFPTKNANDISNTSSIENGNENVFLAKLNSSGGLVFSEIFGSSAGDFGSSITIDNNNNSFITGMTYSTNGTRFPIKNAYQPSYGGGPTDNFVTKFNSSGNLMFSTFLGGNNAEEGSFIAVDSKGNFYITGGTYSRNFPTKNAYQSTFRGLEDAYLAKFNSTGDLQFSTYLGGTNYKFMSMYEETTSTSIGIDSEGNSYIAGTQNLAKFNSTGKLDFNINLGGLIYPTMISPQEYFSFSIALDKNNNIYIAGGGSTNFPIKNAYQKSYSGNSDAFLAKFTFVNGISGNAFLTTTQKPSNKVLTKIANIGTLLKQKNYNLMIGVVTIGLLMSAILVVEYRKYIKTKKNNQNNNQNSFIAYLKSKFTCRSKKLEHPNHVSESIFEKLQEIEEENKPEQ